MTDATKYRRRVSPQDRIQLALNVLGRYNVELVVEGDGELDAGRLQGAVDAAARANPGLRVRLQGRLGFCRWVDCGTAPRVRVVAGSRWDGCSERHAEFLDRFFPLDGGAVADVVLLSGPRTRIVFRALHAAVDGGGIVHWAHEVFRALRGEPLRGAPYTVNDYTFALQQRAKVDYRPAKKVACIPALPAPRPTPAEKTLRYVWRRLDLNGEHSQMLFKLVLFLGEYAHRFHVGPVRFAIPVDWRQRRQAPPTTASMTGVIVVPYHPRDRTRDIAARMRDRLEAYADCYLAPSLRIVSWLPLVGLQAIIGGLVQAHYKPSKSIVTGSIVSLPVILPEDFNCSTFRAETIYALPALVGRLNAVISRQPDKTVLTLAVPAPYQCDGELDRLVAALKAAMNPTSFADQ